MTYLNELMKEQDMSRAELSSLSGIPDSTLRHILNGESQIDHCEAGTLLSLAEVLDTSVEEIVHNYWKETLDKAPVPSGKLHDSTSMFDFYTLVDGIRRLRRLSGDIGLIQDIGNFRWIENFFAAGAYRCALFMVGMVDNLCKKHGLKPPARYEKYRKYCLDQPVYPEEIFKEYDSIYELNQARRHTEVFSVPELARFNIFMMQEDIQPKEKG